MRDNRQPTAGLIPLLRVVPEKNQADRTDALREAWAAFNRLIPNQPLAGVKTVYEPTWDHELRSGAMAVPIINLRGSLIEGRIVVSARLLTGLLTEEER